MTRLLSRDPRQGKAGYVLAWLLGMPLPLLLVIYLVSRACEPRGARKSGS